MRTICFVIHGIGKAAPEFSEPLRVGARATLYKLFRDKAEKECTTFKESEIEERVTFRELLWSEIGSDEQSNLYAKMYPRLFAKTGWWSRVAFAVGELGPVRRMSVTLIGDIFKYLGRFQHGIRRRIFETMTDALKQAQEEKTPISVVIVGHSLGTVIALDLLSNLVKYEYPQFRSLIERMSVITLGSPISLFTLVAENPLPAKIHNWINVTHPWDPIAYPMKSAFPSDNVTDISISYSRHWLLFWRSLTSTHTAYWNHPRVHEAVGAEIFRHIEQNLPRPAESDYWDQLPVGVLHRMNPPTLISGLTEYQNDFGESNFSRFIDNAKRIDICYVYGAGWIDRHKAAITRALCKPDVVVRVALISLASPALPGLLRVYQRIENMDALCEKIKTSMKWYKAAYENAQIRAAQGSGKTGRLQIFALVAPPSHAMYRFDDLIYTTPRPTWGDAINERPIPLISYRRIAAGGMFNWLVGDFEEVIETVTATGRKKGAELIFDSTSGIDNVPPAHAASPS